MTAPDRLSGGEFENSMVTGNVRIGWIEVVAECQRYDVW